MEVQGPPEPPPRPSLPDSARYRYEPIVAAGTTRVLLLSPGDDSGLKGRLEFVQINDSSSEPWRAVSYAWGDMPRTSVIEIEGKILHITPNLENALRSLRQKNTNDGKNCQLWVDQVCIDQDNPDERSMQVELMREIYEKADEVLVYLGPDINGAAGKTFIVLQTLSALNTDQKADSRFPSAEDLALMAEFYNLPWFRRLWVVQEVGGSEEVEVRWGACSINFKHVYEVARMLEHNLIDQAKKFPINSRFPYLAYRCFKDTDAVYLEQAPDFFLLLYQFNLTQDCGDLRDRVFALLGHHYALMGPEKKRIMDADYNLKPSEVYRNLSMRALQDAQSPFLLNMVHHPEQISLPSWVVAWDRLPSDLLCPSSLPTGCGSAMSRKLNARIVNQAGILEISGIKIDTIRQHIPDYGASVDLNECTLQELWSEVWPRESKSLIEAKYAPLGSSALFAFLDTINRTWQSPHFSDTIIEGNSLENMASSLDQLQVLESSVGIVPECPRNAIAASTLQFEVNMRCNTIHEITRDHSFNTTTQGYYGVFPRIVEGGDVVCVLFGTMTPFLLRPRGDRYSLLGACYVHGLMQGQALEALKAGKQEETTFSIV